MITFLNGTLVEALPTQAVVDVNGVGYEALIPLSSFEKLPEPGRPVRLLTHLTIREDSHTLYGFISGEERELFRLIQGVSGIGPRLALNVLSGMSVVAFKAAVAQGDIKALSRTQGVGKKTAERMVVELRDKVAPAEVWEAGSDGRGLSPEEQRINDAALALAALGSKPVEAKKAAKSAQAMLGPKATVEELVRAALKSGIQS